ncbi:MAG: hypothetical protein M2R46_00537 [Verrucomicrobia subdivision 3 bacterium]|nr:hypothetical protein [Limisphaerales bacterium]
MSFGDGEPQRIRTISYELHSTSVHPLAILSDMKDTGIRIGVQRDLHERFQLVCQAQDRPADQVLREFMQTYVDEPEASFVPKAKGR